MQSKWFQINDPEILKILQNYIFGDIFATGELIFKERQLITVICLTVIQCLPQLKAHINAALNIGNTQIEIREEIYTCFSFIGFPRALNALEVFNNIMKEKIITLPLESGKTIKDEERYEKGLEIQKPVFGDALDKMLETVPGKFGEKTAKLTSETYFGDTYTRKYLDAKTRELINVVILIALGNMGLLKPHIGAPIKLGNSKEKLAATLLQCSPYVGSSNAISAMLVLSDVCKNIK